MTHRIALCLGLLCFNGVNMAQQSNVSLKTYCPQEVGQWRATCFAYAPVYTAYSAERNYALNIKDPNDPLFVVMSDGFVASKVKAGQSWSKRLFNRCGKYATAELSMDVLKEVGTVTKKEFPDGCSTSKARRTVPAAAANRITGWVELGDQSTDRVAHLAAVKEALSNGHVVIITLHQEAFFKAASTDEFSFPASYAEHQAQANHVICIVGFRDAPNGTGAFEVKNNYTNWGDGGFAWIPYQDMFKVIRSSYHLVLS